MVKNKIKRSFNTGVKVRRFGRKADVKIIESLGVMLVFFFLLILGMIFYMRVSKISIDQKKQENIERQAVNTALLISYMPELQCNAGDVGESNQNCVDLEKVNAFKATDQKSKDSYYQSLFQYASVSVYQIYPAAGNEIKLYDKPLTGDKITKSNILIPVSLYNPAKKEYGFGMLSVDTYCCAKKG